MDDVENLSTTFVDNREPFPYLWAMWKTHPPFLWKSDCLTDSFVDNVENLSTVCVDKSAASHRDVDDVEKLSTQAVDNFSWHSQTKETVINVSESKTYPHSLWISR